MSLTAGHLSPERARARLAEYANHHATTVDDRWALTAAGRDLYTPALDALGQLRPDAQHATIGDVDPAGARVSVAGTSLTVPTAMRPAVARLRTSRHFAGCLPDEPFAGLFDEQPG